MLDRPDLPLVRLYMVLFALHLLTSLLTVSMFILRMLNLENPVFKNVYNDDNV